MTTLIVFIIAVDYTAIAFGRQDLQLLGRVYDTDRVNKAIVDAERYCRLGVGLYLAFTLAHVQLLRKMYFFAELREMKGRRWNEGLVKDWGEGGLQVTQFVQHGRRRRQPYKTLLPRSPLQRGQVVKGIETTSN